MSEYMEAHTISRLIGAPPGYVGFDQGGLLTDAIAKTPHAVLLLDEIEKAHPQIFNILLQVMDHGKLTDHNGKQTDFRHVVLLMTSNIGVRDLQRRAVGFGGPGGSDREKPDIDREYKQLFSPEFRNRLDAWIAFSGLPRDVILRVVDKQVNEMRDQLREKNVELLVDEGARNWLADHGFSPQFGARPMARLLQQTMKKPLAERILFGDLQGGGRVQAVVREEKIALQKLPSDA
jgi:ATP-dependent Clp protease ATP-binding subunit ClpA